MSAKILINTTQVNTVIEELERQRTSMGRIKSSVGSIKSNCGISGSQKASIERSLSSAISLMEKQTASVKTMGSTLSSIVTLYMNTESELSSVATGAVTAGSSNADSTESESSSGSTVSWKWSDTWKLFAGGGVFGTAIATIGSLYTGDDTPKDAISFLKNLNKFVGAASSCISSGDWKYLFGLNNTLKNVDAKTFTSKVSTLWSKQFGSDLDITGASNTAGKVKVISKWAGHLLTLAGNYVENVEEYMDGDMSVGRVVAETFIETGVDIALGAAATAVIGALCPYAIVGAVAGTLVVWGVNSVCKWITGGKDVGEVVADLVCDTAEYVGEAVSAAAGAVADAAGAVADAVSDAAGAVADAAGAAVDAAKSTVKQVTSAFSTATKWAGSWLGV
ncbi:MAG: hypothetical protein LIO37_05205 [Clostridiales bacterium]|nr:hypothetical protein [Clostridiales bacterium]